ncbi:MAG: hypothetical protein ACRYHQ_31335 [Janthinobacterium lividum]
MNNQYRVITLTLLASITATSLAGCGKSPKEQARERAACERDPQSEDCTNQGRSHSGVSYFFFGQQHYGQPSYYATPGYNAMRGCTGWSTSPGTSYQRPAPTYVPGDDTESRRTTTGSTGGSGLIASPSGGSWSGTSTGSSGAIASEGHVSTGGFGSSAAGHAGGGGGGE